MISSRFALAGALSLSLAAAVGCSHEEKPPVATPRPVTQAPPPPTRKVVAQAPAEPAEIPKQKEDPAVFFDFDSSLLKDDGRRVLQEVADSVRSKKNASLQIAGNCDELGTTEYNLALGEERARAAKTYLTHLGVPAGRIATVSYGSQRPKYEGHDDDAHAKNRRDDLIVH
jgi:peptidoglycan-associated lipoprotein